MVDLFDNQSKRLTTVLFKSKSVGVKITQLRIKNSTRKPKIAALRELKTQSADRIHSVLFRSELHTQIRFATVGGGDHKLLKERKRWT